MGAVKPNELEQVDGRVERLSEVLYPNGRSVSVPEREWVALVHLIAAGDQQALHTLYERTQSLVFTLALRITGARETAEEVTLDVFHDVWRRAADYDEENGTVVGWLMNQARSRAIDRLRYDQRKKRSGEPPPFDEASATVNPMAHLEDGQALRDALLVLSEEERRAIEEAFFSGLTHTEVAEHLGAPVGTVKTRIRTGLLKLRRALTREESSDGM